MSAFPLMTVSYSQSGLDTRFYPGTEFLEGNLCLKHRFLKHQLGIYNSYLGWGYLLIFLPVA